MTTTHSSADTVLERGQVPLDELVSIDRAHDVRRLRACTGCDGLGMKENMLKVDGSPWHARCFVREFGATSFLRLPAEQLERVTLGDIGVRLCRRIVRELQRAGRIERASSAGTGEKS